MAIDLVWHKEQIRLYSQEELPHYTVYAQTLDAILKAACRLYAPMAIVQARPKSVSSFAEKAVRKAGKYSDPARQLTDLCGARVITLALDEADAICAFIQATMVVDSKNSLDVRTRLKESEFGYLSLHYVVQLRGKDILGVPIPAEIGDRKAEIQVRTLLQHAWASISHDRLYKAGFEVPARFKREGALLAAAMEEGDAAFTRFSAGLAAYEGYGLAYHNKQEREAEFEVLTTVLQNEPETQNRPAVALRLARVAKAAGDYQRIQAVLSDFAGTQTPERPEILLELGHALVEDNRKDPASAGYRRGQELLAEAAQPPSAAMLPVADSARSRHTRATALALLAVSFSRARDQEHEALTRYQQALELEPDNPYHLVSLLEHEVYCTRNPDSAATLRPALTEALKTCRAHIEVGIELPRAFFTLGRIHLLLKQSADALLCYLKAVQICNAPEAGVPAEVYTAELEFLRRINPMRALPEEHTWAERLLLLAKSVRTGMVEPALRKQALSQQPFRTPVVIVAGGANPEFERELAHYSLHLGAALEGFAGTVISGATKSGIPGLVGALSEQKGRQFDAVGYLPRNLPVDATRDNRYVRIIVTASQSLGFNEPLQNWIDLLASGTQPAAVRLLGVNGGPVAAFEYRLALALGAQVGVIESSGRAASELCSDPDWSQAPNLLRLPNDPMTCRAFIQAVRPPSSADEQAKLDKLGAVIHSNFCREHAGRQKPELSLMPWGKLREDYKESNRQQAAHAEQLLRAVGFGVRPSNGTPKMPVFTPEQIEIMAEREHGRWNVDKLCNGWRYGPVKDAEKKLTPFLVPWNRLPDEIKQYDRNAVSDFPQVLAQAGLEVYALSQA